MVEFPQDIQNANWAISTGEFGAIVTGVNEINQTIGLILSTKKGTDPFRPNFGSDIWEYIDTPINTAGPNIVLAITEAIGRWEPRVKIVEITYTTQPQGGADANTPAGLVFSILWKLIGGTQQEINNLVVGVDSTNENIIFVLGTPDGSAILSPNNNLIQL